MTRRKAPAHGAPATIEEAAPEANRYAEIDADIAAIEAERKARLAQVNADFDERIARRKDDIVNLFARLKAWWEAGGAVTLPKGQRSGVIGGCTIGVRKTPPKIGYTEKRKEADALHWLRSLRWSGVRRFVRIKVELDKPAILKSLQAADDDARTLAKAFAVKQRDEFFIEPIAPRQPDTEEVPA